MSIATRARVATAQAATYPPFANRFDDPAGYAIRIKLATKLACLLGIDPAQVIISDDSLRRYAGRYVWPLLEVTDPTTGNATHSSVNQVTTIRFLPWAPAPNAPQRSRSPGSSTWLTLAASWPTILARWSRAGLATSCRPSSRAIPVTALPADTASGAPGSGSPALPRGSPV